MSDMLTITAAGFTFGARFEPAAPSTVAAFRSMIPWHSKIVQVRWSGEAAWIPLGDKDFGVGYENHTCHPAPGQFLLYPGGITDPEVIMAYGACSFSSKVGPLAGNHFVSLTSGLHNLRDLGNKVMWDGAQDIFFDFA